ncbi:hypothetical protein INR49_015305 [Caranx melampygus]|nr:hypothetical protein INR49_015305 [Caranx melampygus]
MDGSFKRTRRCSPISPRSGAPGFTTGQYSEAGPSADNKMALTDFGSFRPAPVLDQKKELGLPLGKAGLVHCLTLAAMRPELGYLQEVTQKDQPARLAI